MALDNNNNNDDGDVKSLSALVSAHGAFLGSLPERSKTSYLLAALKDLMHTDMRFVVFVVVVVAYLLIFVVVSLV
jgi:hypothetical protein